MRFTRVLQWEGLIDVQFQLPGANPTEHVAGTLQECFTCQCIVCQAWTGDEQRALGAELRQIECRHPLGLT